MHTTIPDRNGHAVVIGASMAGLLAARVCADHFEHVTLIDRDATGDSAQTRKGVPQGRLLHVLLPGGLQTIDRLLPGYSEQLRAAGAVSLRIPADGLMLLPTGWADRRANGGTLLSASRPLIEHLVHRRVRALAGVDILERHEVGGLLSDRGGQVVRGVTVRPLDGPRGASRELPADLVVDASGRGSRAPAWLTSLGYPAVAETHVDPDIAYAGRVYRTPDGFSADWRLLMLFSQPPSMPRTGYLYPIEHGRWMVTLMGAAGQHPPTDEHGFMAFARSLRHPVLADAIAGAEPITPILGYRGTANRLRHYERARRRPERFIVLGDAVCAFNPIYGQGMTTAAAAAQTLDECLRGRRRELEALAGRFQRRLAKRNADAWMLSTGEDLRFPTTTGSQVTAATRLLHLYLDRVVAASTHDPGVAVAYTRVLGMLARPASLFAPNVAVAAARARPAADITHTPSATEPARVLQPAGTHLAKEDLS